MTAKALKPTKPFFNYEEQIRNLIERKGMVITDIEFATSKLEILPFYFFIDIMFYLTVLVAPQSHFATYTTPYTGF